MVLSYRRELKREKMEGERGDRASESQLERVHRKKKKKGNKSALERMKIPFPLFSKNTGRQKIADDLAIPVCNALREWRGLNELQNKR